MLSNRNLSRLSGRQAQEVAIECLLINLSKHLYNVTQFYKSIVLITLHKLTLKRDNVIIKVDL